MKHLIYWIPQKSGFQRDYHCYFDNWDEVRDLRNYIVSHEYDFEIIEETPPDWLFRY